MSCDLKYLRLLSQQFPTCQSAYSEIINLEAILHLPCATEHFISDIHGELEAFTHILNNCSGVIRERVNVLYGDRLSDSERADLCTLIYYPEERIQMLRRRHMLDTEWYTRNLKNLLNLARTLSDNYTRSRVRKLLPEAYGYIIDELLHVSLGVDSAHHTYHERIVDSIIATGAADDFINSITRLIKLLAVTKLHVVGDIYDRGERADRVVDELIIYDHLHGSVDIQWGNHDAAWMGAAAGSEVCIAQVVRTSIHYGRLATLENSYGISLRELALFADATYQEEQAISRLEKAANVILFKLMEQAIARHPSWGMESRCLLGAIDVERGVVTIEGREWPLVTCDFPTLDPEHPAELSEDERRVLDGLVAAFEDSDRLHDHVSFLYDNGSIYKVENDRLLFHGCVPLDERGGFFSVTSGGQQRSGKEYLDYVDQLARRAWTTGDLRALDWMWYLWCGYHSPLAGRAVKTFERAYVADPAAWKEVQDPYFDLVRDQEVCRRVLAEFGLVDEHARIINGHTPVHEIEGDTPIRAGGQQLVIDGGFCRAYHKTTGIAGYTLISDARSLRLKAHRPFTSVAEAITSNDDIASAHEEIIENRWDTPLTVADTDDGARIHGQIADLTELLHAYRSGLLKEKAPAY